MNTLCTDQLGYLSELLFHGEPPNVSGVKRKRTRSPTPIG